MAAASISPARAQLIQQYFPADIPGYAANLSASVVNRMIAQNQADGVEIGDFVIRPQLTESGGYNSSALGTPDSGSGDFDSAAAIRINSDWGRDALGASLTVDNQRYLQLPSASYTNWTAGAGGALTLGNDTATAAYAHLSLNLAATDLGVAGVVNPVPYAVDDVRLSYLKLFSRFSVTPSFEYENFKFGTATGASTINYDTLNHQTESGTITTRYELSPSDAAIVILRGAQAQYAPSSSGDYTDEGGFIGLDVSSGAIFQYRALCGVESRGFPKSGAASVTIPTFELDAVWTPTMLDTITLTASRRLVDSSSPFARNQIVTDARVELDHELRTNVFLSTHAAIASSDTQSGTAGIGGSSQTQFHLGASALWNINRNLRGTLSYGYANSHSSNAASTAAAGTGFPNFSSHTITIGITIFE